jgi:hypothetical protein
LRIIIRVAAPGRQDHHLVAYSARLIGHLGAAAATALRDFDLLMSASGLGRVKMFSCKRSELEEVATRAIFPDFDYALIAAISG